MEENSYRRNSEVTGILNSSLLMCSHFYKAVIYDSFYCMLKSSFVIL